MVTTPDCASMYRVWCLFETNEGMMLASTRHFTVHMSLTTDNKSDTIVACLAGGQPGALLPHTTAETLLRLNVEDARASSESDRQMILHRIAETAGFEMFNYNLKVAIARGIYQQMVATHRDAILEKVDEAQDKRDALDDE